MGYFQVYRKTTGKRMAAKLRKIRQKLRERLNEKTKGRRDGSRRWFADISGTTRYRVTRTA